MTVKKKKDAIRIGLDIGIASVGWAILSDERIIHLGVRCFDKAEIAKDGQPLNLQRRLARLTRNRLRHRSERLRMLTRILDEHGLINRLDYFSTQSTLKESPWQLRVKGLDKKLELDEWARVIYHICKHRGFYWLSRAEANTETSNNETGKVKQALSSTRRLMDKNQYRTVSEMTLAEYPESQRNKQGEYSKSIPREMLADDLHLLFKAQRLYGNAFASTMVEHEVIGCEEARASPFWMQNPPLSGDSLLKMLGNCTLEKDEYRAPKFSFSAERHVFLTRLNNLQITLGGIARKLTSEERSLLLSLPYQRASDVTYKQIRKILTKLILEDFHFIGLRYPSPAQLLNGHAKDPETSKFVSMVGWHRIRESLNNAGFNQEWKSISEDALNGNPNLLDQIAWVLSVFKEDNEAREQLGKLQLPNSKEITEALLYIRFESFSRLSLKALRKILPNMEQGMRYDQACAEVGYHHSNPHQDSSEKSKYLPPFYSGRDNNGKMIFDPDLDVPRNPVVIRALNQARKVLNGIIRKYGSPYSIHIELARELSKPLDERNRIEKDQLKFRQNNEEARTTFIQAFHITGKPKGRDFQKWQLYREQHGKSAYLLEAVDCNRLLEAGYVEIDHILPYSRSYDDSKNNKVLVFTSENRNKGNKTPYEYLGGRVNSERWRRFEAAVNINKSYRPAKRNRLLRKHYGEEEQKEFCDRNLNDTRYICRFFKNHVENNLKLADDSKHSRCIVVNGQLTAFLRARWGLVKDREQNDRHHALDAVVVAACSHGMVKRLADYSRRKELSEVREGFVDISTGEIVNPAMFDKLNNHFPLPWDHFREELLTRLEVDSVEKMRASLSKLSTYSDSELLDVRPLFVSRAPKRRNSGAAHKETVYGIRDHLAFNSVTQRVSVGSLEESDVDDLIDPERNGKMYAALRHWIHSRSANEKRASTIEKLAKAEKRNLTEAESLEVEKLRSLPRKPDKQGSPTGPIIRTVTKVIKNLTGIPVRGGIAKNDTMVRVDVFCSKHKGRFYLVPIYVHHFGQALPNKAIVANKSEKEWATMDDGYDFLFSLYPNDLVKVGILHITLDTLQQVSIFQKNNFPIQHIYP